MSKSKSPIKRGLERLSTAFQSMVDFISGYDFFISYTWRDENELGRNYAVALKKRLTDLNYVCFLDSTDYEKGSDWKLSGQRALRKTTKLLLVATPAVFDSEPVLREVRIYKSTKRQIIPIDVNRTLENGPDDKELSTLIERSILRIPDPQVTTESGPSDKVIEDIHHSFKLTRQNTKRSRYVSGAMMALAGLAALASWQWREAKISLAETQVKVRQLESINLAAQSRGITSKGPEQFYTWQLAQGIGKLTPPAFALPLQLAKRAVEATLEKDGYVNREAFDALREAVEQAPPWGGKFLMDTPDSTPVSIAWSPNGEFFAAMSKLSEIVVWNADRREKVGSATVNPEARWPGSDEVPEQTEPIEPWAIRWCGDNQLLVIGVEVTARLYEINSIDKQGLRKTVSVGNSGVTEASCDSSGSRIALYTRDKIYIHTKEDGKQLALDVPENARQFSWSQNGQFLAFMTDDMVYIWPFNEKSPRRVSLNQLSFLKGHQELKSLRWNRETNKLLAASVSTQTTENCDQEAESEAACAKKKWQFTMLWLEDGNMYSAPVHKEKEEDEVGDDYIVGSSEPFPDDAEGVIAISPDLKWMATGGGQCSIGEGGGDCQDIVIRIWNTETSDLARTMYGHGNQIVTLAWRPDSRALASGSSFASEYCNPPACGEPDNRILVWMPESLWNVNGWQDGNNLKPPGRGWLTTAWWGPDENMVTAVRTRVYCGNCNNEISDLLVAIWNVESRLWNPIKFESDGDGGETNALPMINLSDHMSNPRSPDGTRELFWINRGILIPSFNEESLEYYGEDWKSTFSKQVHDLGLFKSLMNQFNGSPNEVEVIDSAAGGKVALIGHSAWVSTAEWSPPDGKRVLTSSSDETVRIWDAENGREMARYNLKVTDRLFDFARATWSPDGKWILTGHPKMVIWPADVGELLKKADSLIEAIGGNEIAPALEKPFTDHKDLTELPREQEDKDNPVKPQDAIKQDEEPVAMQETTRQEAPVVNVEEPDTSVSKPTPEPSVDKPPIKTGDTYVIESSNPNNPTSKITTERKVISVDAEKITVASRIIANKTDNARTIQFTSEWNVISTRNQGGEGLDYSPPLKYFEFPLYPGKSWRQMSKEINTKTGGENEVTISGTVGDWESVTVPAGTFRAIKITTQTERVDPTNGKTSTGTDVSWYAPNVRRSVKSEVISQNSEGKQEKQLIELIRYDLVDATGTP